MNIAPPSLREFVQTAKSGGFDTPTAKERWHRLARRVAKALAKRMGLEPSEYDIRYNRGGILVSGDTYLHTTGLYVDLSISCLGPEWGFMYRSCEHRKDFTGGANRWMKWDELLDLDAAAAKLDECRSDR